MASKARQTDFGGFLGLSLNLAVLPFSCGSTSPSERIHNSTMDKGPRGRVAPAANSLSPRRAVKERLGPDHRDSHFKAGRSTRGTIRNFRDDVDRDRELPAYCRQRYAQPPATYNSSRKTATAIPRGVATYAFGVPPGQTGAVASIGQPIGASDALRAVSIGAPGSQLAAT
jgi:hypothetical protein